jgi:hypothetical protein
MKRSRHAELRALFRGAAEEYFSAVTQSGWSDDARNSRRHRLAALALQLHLFEQGLRAGKRGER